MTQLSLSPLVSVGRRVGLPRIEGNLGLSLAALVCVTVTLLALLGPFFAPYLPSQTDILHANEGISLVHWLGTDDLGRDILSRALNGARLSLLGPLGVVVLATTLGTGLAIAAAWFGGWFDRAVTRVANVLLAFPALLFAVLAVAVFGPGLLAPVIALAVAYTPYFLRVGRSVAIKERNLAYVYSCRLAGFSGWRICVRHILPNITPVVRAQATIAFGFALIDLAAVSFIGLGVQPPTAEWGLMVADGKSALLNGFPLTALVPSLLIIITVVGFNLLGDRLAARSERR
jgi:peptide/nickel transport system permease protein